MKSDPKNNDSKTSDPKNSDSKASDSTKKFSARKWIRIALISVLALVFIGSAAYIFKYCHNSKKEAENYSNLQHLKEDGPTTPRPVINGDGTVTPPSEPPAMVEVTDPKTGETIQILPEFKELYLKNSDLVGWIEIPGTDINYPVMHAPTQKDYYLTRNFNKEESNHGCLYIQENCDVFAPTENVIIYGHRMRDRSMFAQLDKFEKKEFWEANQYIYFDTLKEVHTYQIMAVIVTTATEDSGFPYHKFVNLSEEDRFKEFANACKGWSLFSTGIEAVPGDKLITLSTCDYTNPHGRLVVVAKRIT